MILRKKDTYMANKKFFMGFWNYTRAGRLNEAQAACDWKELGMNLAMSSIFLRGDDKRLMLAQLDEAEKNEIKLIICDERTLWRNLENGEENYIKEVESAVADFGAHPAFYAFCVGDEPSRKELELAIKAVRIVDARSKAFLNFLPMADEPFVSDYLLKDKHDYEGVLADAVERSGISTICYDNYTQCYMRNKEYGIDQYFDNLRIYRNVAERCGTDFWTTLLCVGHWFYRVPTENDIRWQISTAAAHGVKGLLWFFIYSRDLIEDNYRDAPIDCFYRRTPMFDILARQNNIFMKFFAERFAQAKLEKVYHYKTAYGGMPLYRKGDIAGLDLQSEYGNNLILSEFSSPDGDFLVVVNNMQGAGDSDKVYGTLNEKPFQEWLAPGQMAIIEK